MVPFKTLTEKEVLEAIAIMIGLSLPEEISKKNYEIQVSFSEDDDNSVDVFLIDSDLEN